MSYSIATINEVNEKIWTIIHQTPTFDIHTQLFDLRFKPELIKTGIDELLTTPELAAELFRHNPPSLNNPGQELTRNEYESMPQRIKSEVVWHRLFLANTPLSESTRAVLTILGLLQQDPKTRNLGAYRNFFNNSSRQQHISKILEQANINGLVTCYNPLSSAVQKAIKINSNSSKLYTALDLSELVCNWKKSYEKLTKTGFTVKRVLDKSVYPIVKNFLTQMIETSNAVYLYLNLPSESSLNSKNNYTAKLITKCIAPLSQQLGKPLAIAFSDAKKAPTLNSLKMNQPLQFSNLDFIQELSTKFPELKLMVTDSNYENQQNFILLAQSNPRLMPVLQSAQLTGKSNFTSLNRQSLELLGTSFIAHGRTARVYEELLSNWAHTRWMLGTILQERYTSLYRTGWRVTEQEIIREISAILSDNARKFIGI